MNIGFYIKWDNGSLNSKTNVIGDELLAESMCKSIRAKDTVESCELYAPNHKPRIKLDAMIYLNDTHPCSLWAKKSILYMQNGYGGGSLNALNELKKQYEYDGYAFVSNKLLDIHKSDGDDGIFLPFGVDTNLFNPRKYDQTYGFEVSYVGNDIKGTSRTNRYLYPAKAFDFGLFGNWNRRRSIKNYATKIIQPRYKKKFESISQGKIPQTDVPKLYSSSKINLNCTLQDCVDWDVITLRTYEVLACKGFLITDKVPIAESTMDGCAVFTDGGDGLKETIEYYLHRDKERVKIANKGYEYVIQNTTIDARAAELLKYIAEIV